MSRTVHSTAVASIVTDKSFGIAPDADFHFYRSLPFRKQVDKTFPLQATLLDLIDKLDFAKKSKSNAHLSEGDVLLISLQHDIEINNQNTYVPVDLDTFINEYIEELINKFKLMVFIAAGNDCLDCDTLTELYGYRKGGNKSRALLTGYCSTDYASPILSNTGECIEMYVPAESVTAACYDYSSLAGDTNLLDNYSAGFRRTSAATPIAAAFAASLQSAYKIRKGRKKAHLSLDDFRAMFKKASDEQKSLVPLQNVLTGEVCQLMRGYIMSY